MRFLQALFLSTVLTLSAHAQAYQLITNPATGQVYVDDGSGQPKLLATPPSVNVGVTNDLPGVVPTHHRHSTNAVLNAVQPQAVPTTEDSTKNSATHDNFTIYSAWLTALIPILIALLKTLAPKIPKQYLPIIAPVLGAALDALTSYISGNAINPALGAILGMAAVGGREVWDQIRNPSVPPPSVTTTDAAGVSKTVHVDALPAPAIKPAPPINKP